MKIHMYEDVPNFGDVLNKYLWPRFFAKFIGRDDNILMFGIGTLLGSPITHPGPVVVCGSGCGYGNKVDESIKAKTKIFFVRGPLSAKMLDLPESFAITDPAVLTPEIFPPAPANGKIIFVPHWETSRNPLWRLACERAGIEYVDPLAPLETVLASISSAKLIIAEAMHAAIIGDAYGVPWVPVSTSERINLFKWNDWAASLGMTPVFNFLKPLGASDRFRNMTGKGRTLSMGNATSVPPKASLPKKIVRTLYRGLVPKMIRDRKDHHLYWTIGPAIDRFAVGAAKFGLPSKSVDAAAQELKRLSTMPGTLSDRMLTEEKRRRMKDVFKDVEAYLDAA